MGERGWGGWVWEREGREGDLSDSARMLQRCRVRGLAGDASAGQVGSVDVLLASPFEEGSAMCDAAEVKSKGCRTGGGVVQRVGRESRQASNRGALAQRHFLAPALAPHGLLPSAVFRAGAFLAAASAPRRRRARPCIDQCNHTMLEPHKSMHPMRGGPHLPDSSCSMRGRPLRPRIARVSDFPSAIAARPACIVASRMHK